MFTEPIIFYFIKTGPHGNLFDDLQTISNQLGTYAGSGFGLKSDKNSLTISYNNTQFQAVLIAQSKAKNKDIAVSNQLILTCEKTDGVSLNLLRGIVKSMGYRIYNPTLSSYSAVDPNLIDLTTTEIDAKIIKIFSDKKLVPIYRYINSLVFYAKDPKDGSIHLINSHLLSFLIDNKSIYPKQKQFSTKVAEDIGTFIALLDRNLIPLDFYQHYHHPSNIINLSGFDINKLEEDIRILPVYFRLDIQKQQFSQLNKAKFTPNPKNVNKGMSLKKLIINDLKKINHKENIISVKISRNINYIEEGSNLIPLLSASIFLGKIN